MHIDAFSNSKSFKQIKYKFWEKEKDLENGEKANGPLLSSPLPQPT
jgi:hypothetical protein